MRTVAGRERLEHFQEKWNPVFRPKMRQCKNAKAVSVSGLCEAALERGDRGVQRGARPHRGRRLGGIGQVVTADVDRLALRADQLAIDLRLVLAERLG